MKTRYLDHIDLRVRDLKRAREFYAKLLPALGFTCDRSDPEWGTFYAVGRDEPAAFFGFTEDRQHQPNGTRISFWADSRAEVDRIAELVREIGGQTLEGPELCEGYSPGYYAFFFEDPDGNKLEICSRENPIVAEQAQSGKSSA
jgi:catechol 2,3-dioxygenase-like lactoylglutathione lyase family enzyme